MLERLLFVEFAILLRKTEIVSNRMFLRDLAEHHSKLSLEGLHSQVQKLYNSNWYSRGGSLLSRLLVINNRLSKDITALLV